MMEGDRQQAERRGGVTGFEVVPYALPFREPYTTARGTLKRREMVLLRVHTSEGLVGLGEAVPLSLRGGLSLDYIVDELRGLRDAFAEASKQGRSELLTRAFFQLSAPSRCALFTALGRHGGQGPGRARLEAAGSPRKRPAFLQRDAHRR